VVVIVVLVVRLRNGGKLPAVITTCVSIGGMGERASPLVQELSSGTVDCQLPDRLRRGRIFSMSLLAQLYAAKWLLLSAILVGYAAIACVSKYRRLRAFPGPPSTGWCELLHMRAILGRHSHIWYQKVGERYGE
jgi:hypothetical protein